MSCWDQPPNDLRARSPAALVVVVTQQQACEVAIGGSILVVELDGGFEAARDLSG